MGSELPVPLRNVTLKEDEGEIQVCLWRESNLVPITDGMLILVSHLRGKNAPNHGFSFHSTAFTEVELLSMTKKIKVEGLRVLECGDAELLQENGTRIVVDRAIWLNVYGDKLRGQVEERLSFYETGDVPRKNLDFMKEAVKEATEIKRKRKKREKTTLARPTVKLRQKMETQTQSQRPRRWRSRQRKPLLHRTEPRKPQGKRRGGCCGRR
ncbi:nucleolar protein 56-like [Trematomus bernacchii]|uniref:nucleolar protein 56-like n=1 Tax=Trematomus bernacchii TaxID=40690 RepID=UPI00146B01E5|nr:nucleolar protein 56-like [Trematomus bernacchii]